MRLQVCILDGFGYNTEDKWNGIHMAETPVYDSLRQNEERFRWGRRNHHGMKRQKRSSSTWMPPAATMSGAGSKLCQGRT